MNALLLLPTFLNLCFLLYSLKEWNSRVYVFARQPHEDMSTPSGSGSLLFLSTWERSHTVLQLSHRDRYTVSIALWAESTNCL